MTTKTKQRCAWCTEDSIYIDYHDKEWGVPVYDDRLLFEFLILEGMQAGLSWLTVLKKRQAFRVAFEGFSAKKIAAFNQRKMNALMNDAGIIRNNLKINAAVQNAKAYLEVVKEYGSFSDYIWQFVKHKPIKNKWNSIKQIPAKTAISDAMSKDLKKRGFKFVGSTICYAFMQAVGMVNDHSVDCFRYKKQRNLKPLKKIKNHSDYVTFDPADYVDNPIALARIKIGITQAQLAKRMKVTQAYISKIERQDSVTAKMLQKVKVALAK